MKIKAKIGPRGILCILNNFQLLHHRQALRKYDHQLQWQKLHRRIPDGIR
jgi:hypothetical protein